jgi:hypothetical protein
MIMLVAAILLVPACAVSLRGPSHGHGHSSYRSEGHGHRHHRHWNAAGPAYAEASVLTQIAILPAKLPAVIDGEFTPAQEAAWRKDWPVLAAQLIADGLTTRTDGVVTGTVAETQPKTGYYMKLEINFLDVGDVRQGEGNTPGTRGCFLAAHGVIINAATGQLVADVKFREGSGWASKVQFEVLTARAGSSLGDWFKARRSSKS